MGYMDDGNTCGNCQSDLDEEVQSNGNILLSCPDCGRQVMVDKNYSNPQILNPGEKQEEDEDDDDEDSEEEEPSPKKSSYSQRAKVSNMQPPPQIPQMSVPDTPKSSGTNPIVIYLMLGLVVVLALILGAIFNASILAGGVVLAFILIGLALTGIKQVEPTERGLIKRLGKYNRFANPGLVIMWPLIENLTKVNITEQLVSISGDRIITKDSLNLDANAQIYFQIQADEDSVKKSQFAVNNFQIQIINLANTTLRNVIGGMNFADANSQRGAINKELADQLEPQVEKWGIEIVRTELSSLNPPQDVQDSMNKVIESTQNMNAAINNATATETEADGKRRAAIKESEGQAQAIVNVATARAQEIKLINEAAVQYFKDGAITLEQLKTVQIALKDNAKIILGKDGGQTMNLIVGELGKGIVPVPLQPKSDKQ